MPKEKVKKIKLNQTLELFFRQKLIDKLIIKLFKYFNQNVFP